MQHRAEIVCELVRLTSECSEAVEHARSGDPFPNGFLDQTDKNLNSQRWQRAVDEGVLMIRELLNFTYYHKPWSG